MLYLSTKKKIARSLVNEILQFALKYFHFYSIFRILRGILLFFAKDLSEIVHVSIKTGENLQKKKFLINGQKFS